MRAELFIARKLKFKGRIAMFCVAVSFVVMIVAVAVSAGFRKTINDGIASVAGDVTIVPANSGYITGENPIESAPSYLSHINDIPYIKSIEPVVYRAGIVKNKDNIQGVLFKGVTRNNCSSTCADSSSALASDRSSLEISIPSRLSNLLELQDGDDLLSYFIGEKIRTRKFKVTSVYDEAVGSDQILIIYADVSDIRRINGWSENQVSAFEIMLDDSHRTESSILESVDLIAEQIAEYSSDEDSSVVCSSTVSSFPQLFDWLDLLDFNVLFILILMTFVAGFNMISGLLILLFENISLIGILKSLGMENKSIAEVFLRVSSSLVLKGMLIGNVIAMVFCIIQSTTGFLTLDPKNYFVSEVPVSINVLKILVADAVAYIIIMLLLMLPSLFISHVDPAKTVRMN